MGALLRTSQGTYVQVAAVTARSEWASVYNLTVADLHTFYVGDTGVLVHNTSPVCLVGNSDKLRNALNRVPSLANTFGTNSQAHHIFLGAKFGGQTGLDLQQLGVDLNGAANGVFLPQYNSGLPPGFRGAFRNGRSRKIYEDYVEQNMGGVTTKQEAEARLAELRDLVLNGCLPINSAGVRVLPAQGSCPVALYNYYFNRGADIYQGTWPPT